MGGSDAGDPVRARVAMDESMPEKFKFRVTRHRHFLESQFLLKRQHKKHYSELEKAQNTLQQNLLPPRTPLGIGTLIPH